MKSAIKWPAATVFKTDDGFNLLDDLGESLNRVLQEKAFVPCNNRQLVSVGWVPPFNDSERLVFESSANTHMLKLRREEKILPACVIAEHMAERIENLEKTLDRKVRGKEKLDIRDNVIMELTPRAFSKSTYVNVLIIPGENLLIVNSTTAKTVDLCTQTLRDCIGSLPIRPLQTNTEPGSLFSRWVKGTRKMPNNVTLGNGVTLINEDDRSAKVAMTQQDLLQDDIREMANGRAVTKLALHYGEGISFTLSEDWGFSKIKFVGTQEEDDNQEDLDAAGLYDTNATYIGLELSAAVNGLVDVFGGLQDA